MVRGAAFLGSCQGPTQNPEQPGSNTQTSSTREPTRRGEPHSHTPERHRKVVLGQSEKGHRHHQACNLRGLIPEEGLNLGALPTHTAAQCWETAQDPQESPQGRRRRRWVGQGARPWTLSASTQLSPRKQRTRSPAKSHTALKPHCSYQFRRADPQA